MHFDAFVFIVPITVTNSKRIVTYYNSDKCTQAMLRENLLSQMYMVTSLITVLKLFEHADLQI
jgi:hypothetical protein